MTDNLKSKSLCDPAKNHTMPLYSFLSEISCILKDVISQALQYSLWVKPTSIFKFKVRPEEKLDQRGICSQTGWKFYHLPILLLM